MNSLFHVEIPKRNIVCSHAGERLISDMEIHSLLLEENEQLTRRDFCGACWNIIRNEIKETEKTTYWKSKIERKPAQKPSTRIDRALLLLKEWQQKGADFNELEKYVLCLFLAHARQITMRKEFKNEGELFRLYEITSQQEFITVKVIDLSPSQIEKIQQSLASQLND